jgi:hypothetical protein
VPGRLTMISSPSTSTDSSLTGVTLAVGPRRREAAVGHSHRLQQNGRSRSRRSTEALGFRAGAEGLARLQDAWPPFATIGSVCGSRSLAIVDRR